MKNKYIIEIDHVKIFIKDIYFIIDLEDFEYVSIYSWSLSKNGYPSCGKNNKQINIQRYLLEKVEGKIIDHINRNKLDNRRCNLRYVEYSENSFNRNKNKSKTGVAGIYKRRNGYQVQIYKNGVCYYLGDYKIFEEAVKARKNGELKYYGYTVD